MAAVIEVVLPRTVACAEAFTDCDEPGAPAEEVALIAGAVPERRREFATGRSCARTALARLGVPASAILSDAHGGPQWPPGVLGSITHCAGYRAAAVARATDLDALGIDAEPNDPLPAGVIDLVASEQEAGQLAHLARSESEPVCWDRLLFCAKEAIYKAWFPRTSRWLGFEDSVVTINPTQRTFQARLPTADSATQRLSGRWIVRDALIAAVAMAPTNQAISTQQ